MSGTPDVTVAAINIVITRPSRRDYRATCHITNSDKTETTLQKDWTGKTIGYVNTEINKLKNEFIKNGVAKNKITVQELK